MRPTGGSIGHRRRCHSWDPEGRPPPRPHGRPPWRPRCLERQKTPSRLERRGTGEDKDFPSSGRVHEQLGAREEPGRAQRSCPRRVTTRVPPRDPAPPDTAGGDRLIGMPRGSPGSVNPWAQRPFCVPERALRSTLARSHGAGFPPCPRGGWRETAPSPARREP